MPIKLGKKFLKRFFMAKKKTKNLLGMLLPVAAALLAVVAFCMMFVPAVQRVSSISDKLIISYTGAQVTFGYTEPNTDAAILGFSFMNFVPYLLLLVGIAFSVLSVLGKLGKIAPIVSAACFLVAGILFFLAPQMMVYATDSKDLADGLKEGLSLGAGAIVAGIMSILSALASAALLFANK